MKVTLAQYAGVLCGTAAGLPVEEVARNEGVEPGDWSRVEAAWTERLMADLAVDGDLQEQLDEEVARARERYARSVTPLDADLQGWLDFVRAFGAHADPPAMLGEIGLTPADMLHLHASWSRRLALDPGLQRQAQQILARAPHALPAIEVGPLRVVPPPREEEAAAAAIELEPLDEPAPIVAAPAEERPAHDPASDHPHDREPPAAPPPPSKPVYSWFAGWQPDLGDEPPERTLPEPRGEVTLPPPPTHKPRWPFQPSTDAAAAPFSGSAAPAKARLGSTAPIAKVALRPVLPFLPRPPAGVPPGLDETRPPVAAGEPALPFTSPGRLTLEQYASLLVDIALNPGHEEEISGRYGLTSESKRVEDASWEQRLMTDLSLRDRFRAAADEYRAWRRRRDRGT